MRFGIALLAVVLGNILYFLLLPHLPPLLRHAPTRLDPGLALDFFFCLSLWMLLNWAERRGQAKGGPSKG